MTSKHVSCLELVVIHLYYKLNAEIAQQRLNAAIQGINPPQSLKDLFTK
jgi:5,10-methylene-tetrahydrofolate dehydrogenase/methenyl tetrahydrofolate cyclohydrolase